MGTFLLVVVVVSNLALLCGFAVLFRHFKSYRQTTDLAVLLEATTKVHDSLCQRFSAATADMASRLEGTKGDLRQEVTDRLSTGFNQIRGSVEDQLTMGRREQAERLLEVRGELTQSLALTTGQLKQEFETLNRQTAERLESIRSRVDEKLLAITD